jgi:hypothetical protein
MPNQISAMFESLKAFWDQLLQFLPQIFIGALLMIIGWILARLLRAGIVKFFKIIRIDALAEKVGLEDFLLKGGVQYSTVNIIAGLFYWFIMFALTLAVLNSLGFGAAEELFHRILLYIPNVIIAILVLVFGTLFAKFARGVTFTYLSNIGISGAELIGNITRWAIVFLVVSVALQQLSLGGQILVSVFEIAFGGVCLALAIAFGLAGKEWATQILEKLWRHSR